MAAEDPVRHTPLFPLLVSPSPFFCPSFSRSFFAFSKGDLCWFVIRSDFIKLIGKDATFLHAYYPRVAIGDGIGVLDLNLAFLLFLYYFSFLPRLLLSGPLDKSYWMILTVDRAARITDLCFPCLFLHFCWFERVSFYWILAREQPKGKAKQAWKEMEWE